MGMNLSVAQKALCEELGIKIEEKTNGEYVLTIEDAEILSGNDADISEYLERMVEAQNIVAQGKTGNAIKKLREENKISIRDFAYSILKTPEELELIESGRIRPDNATLSLIGNMFGVSASALKEGELKELAARNDIHKILKNIEDLLTEIKHDNAEMREFIQKWNLTEVYEQTKVEKAETKAEEQQTDTKMADESLSRYTVVPRSATIHASSHTSGKEMEDGYYVVVDTYTGEIVTDVNGMEQQFTNQAAALAFAVTLEQNMNKATEAEQNVEIDTELIENMENEPDKDAPEVKMKM